MKPYSFVAICCKRGWFNRKKVVHHNVIYANTLHEAKENAFMRIQADEQLLGRSFNMTYFHIKEAAAEKAG